MRTGSGGRRKETQTPLSILALGEEEERGREPKERTEGESGLSLLLSISCSLPLAHTRPPLSSDRHFFLLLYYTLESTVVSQEERERGGKKSEVGGGSFGSLEEERRGAAGGLSRDNTGFVGMGAWPVLSARVSSTIEPKFELITSSKNKCTGW